MKLLRLSLVTIFLLCLVCISKVSAQDDDSKSPPAKILPVTQEIEAALTKAMQGCPAMGSKVHGGINKNGVYTLTGNLFHNGQTNALIDNHDNIILGEWKGKQWKATVLIAVTPIWRSPTFIEDDWLGQTVTAKKPFWLLWLQGNPLLIVGSDPDKYGQEFAVQLLDPKTSQLLDSCSSYQEKPTIKHGFLVCSDGSRRKSEWETTYFYKIKNGKFSLNASSGSCLPWRSGSVVEQEYFTVTTQNNAYVITDAGLSSPFESADGKLKQPLGGDIETINITNNEKPYAVVSFNFKKIVDANMFDRVSRQEMPYITWKLSGLPKLFFTDDDRLNDLKHAIIKVTGNPEAVKLLSP